MEKNLQNLQTATVRFFGPYTQTASATNAAHVDQSDDVGEAVVDVDEVVLTLGRSRRGKKATSWI